MGNKVMSVQDLAALNRGLDVDKFRAADDEPNRGPPPRRGGVQAPRAPVPAERPGYFRGAKVKPR